MNGEKNYRYFISEEEGKWDVLLVCLMQVILIYLVLRVYDNIIVFGTYQSEIIGQNEKNYITRKAKIVLANSVMLQHQFIRYPQFIPNII